MTAQRAAATPYDVHLRYATSHNIRLYAIRKNHFMISRTAYSRRPIGPYDVNIYKHNRLNFREYELFYNQKDFPIVDIDGQGVNDVFFVGYKDGVAHYNGKSFKTYRESIMKDARFESVAQAKNTVFCVGGFFNSNNSIVVVGKRTGDCIGSAGLGCFKVIL